MKAVMIMFDSLNKKSLSPYNQLINKTPNFSRLADKAVTFNSCFAGSLPCMPARRELHTGRYNFLHRCWGPIEPFDDSMPEILKNNGVYTHLVSDHAHYWEDGGSTYHTRYNSWEGFRGQEGDYWKGSVADPDIPHGAIGRKKHSWRQDWVNREYIKSAEDMPMHKTFSSGMQFIEKNHTEDNWFLQIETFAPHEPYYITEDLQDKEFSDYSGPHFDWPQYIESSNYTDDQIDHVQKKYKAVISRCDYYLGRVLDYFDKYQLWDDTMLIINTDHGFLLGEHGWFGKNRMPTYTEIANIPLFIWDPKDTNTSDFNDKLVQTIDIPPSLLDFFNIKIPADMQGKPIKKIMNSQGSSLRESVLFGLHGGHINMYDGKFLFMRAPTSPENRDSFNYTLMAAHINRRFSTTELTDMELVPPLSFTKGCQVLKIRALNPSHNTYQHTLGDFLFDLSTDPDQKVNLISECPHIVALMKEKMGKALQESSAPEEIYQRYALP
jgi:arylsulfatase A-like enzyme